MICLGDTINISDNMCSEIYRDYETMIPEDLHDLYSARGWDYSMQIANGQLKQNHVVLDIGCGASYFIIFLARYVSKVYGIDDIEKGGFEDVTKPWMESLPRFDAFRNNKVHFVNSNAAKLPFPDNYFDRVFTTSVLEHFQDDDDILCVKEINRVLRPGGLFLGTVDYNPITEYPVECENRIRVYTYNAFVNRIMRPSELELVGEDLVNELAIPVCVDFIAAPLFFLLRKQG